MTTYFSLPASREANLVYQTATLKAMETISNTASCWALGGEKPETVGYVCRLCSDLALTSALKDPNTSVQY